MFEKINYYHHFQIEYPKANFVEQIKDFIIFVNANLSGIIGIIFFLFLCYFIWHYLIHNFYIQKRFKRERITKKKNFRIARCAEEKKKKRIYVVYEKSNHNGGKYYHILNGPTYRKLGYNFDDDVGEDFSKKGKKIGKRIEFHDIKSDILFIIGSVEKMKELKKDIEIKP